MSLNQGLIWKVYKIKFNFGDKWGICKLLVLLSYYYHVKNFIVLFFSVHSCPIDGSKKWFYQPFLVMDRHSFVLAFKNTLILSEHFSNVIWTKVDFLLNKDVVPCACVCCQCGLEWDYHEVCNGSKEGCICILL